MYDIFDDTDATRVYITIVSTPTTQRQFDRPEPSNVSAASMQEGLAQVFAEIENSLTSPVGGRTVFVPATGEIAFVGFGSAVVGRDDNRATQARLELNSERIALVRAKDALCEILLGETLEGSEGLDSELAEATRTFNELTRDDPLVVHNPNHPGYVKLQDRQASFKAAEIYQSVVESARQGVLPPGVRQQSWLDEDGSFAYAIAVYVPSVSDIPSEPVTPLENPQGPSGRVQNIDGL